MCVCVCVCVCVCACVCVCFNFRNSGFCHQHLLHIFKVTLNAFKAAQSVTFDLLILEIMFLFYKKTAKILKSGSTFYHFCKSSQVITIKTTAFLLKINGL